MKIFILTIRFLVIAILLFVYRTDAEQGNTKKTPEERTKMLTDKMKERLALTDAQYQPAYNINLKYARKNDELAKSADDPRTKYQKLRLQLSAKEREFKALLTPGQYEKYAEIKNEMLEEARKTYRNRNRNK